MTRIALIEDNPDNRLLVVTLLEDDYEIDEYEDGSSALIGIAENKPDVILLDISLPGMDGTEVLAELKKGDAADVPTVALTAHAMDGDRERFLALGFDAYLSKPIVDEEDLFSLLRQLVGSNSPA